MVRAIAREIRAASGGLKGVKAMGVLAHGRAQLSMNITDFEVTPISQVYRTVSAWPCGTRSRLAEGEVIGLLPEAACERESEWMRQLSGFDPQTKILEQRLESPLGLALEMCAGEHSTQSPKPTPGNAPESTINGF
jgi:glutamate formiminotransferase / 5-formyltetrahydrofolate cyclo-ligase